ncbi:MAG: hypothetical protein IPG24_14510 [Leptospiraceae bacterium]|nr:hypothetical protein [Leptospiraceae bacterium]
MAIDSCIQNVGEYYSSHYLDTIFANDLTGLIAKWKEEGTASTPAKIKRLAQKYFKAKARAIELSIEKRNEDEEINSFHSELLEALGYKEYQGEEFLVEGDTSYIPVKANFTRHNALYLTICETFFTLPENSLPEKKGSEEPLELFPLASTVISNEREKSILQNNDSVKQDRPLTVGQFEVTGGHLPLADGDWEKLIGKIFTAEVSPRWVLFLAGTFIYLFNKTTYSQGRYLLFNLDDAFGKNTQDASNQLAAFLSYETLCPEGESEILHERLEQQSHKFAYGVTEKLQQSVREAIELLANEWIEARKRKKLSYNSLSPEEKKGYLNSNVKEDKLEVSAENLKNEALTFAYRLLFCFYAESRGEELGILPVDSDQYLKGYSLEALRDLEQVPLTSQSEMGTYFHEHLSILFQIIYKGFNASSRDGVLIAPENKVFQIQPLTASLFAPEYTPLFNTVKFPNHVWQKVLVRLSLAKHEKSKSIGRVNYAELGVNQLGAVYEGLLSYQGMFAKEDLIHVKSKDGSFGDNSTQTYFVSADRSKEFSKEEIEAEDKRVKIYKKGAFILHLNSIDREKSASHYTPFVLTKSLVEESLRELLKDFKPSDADSILAFKLCEPAMGSGAFIEEMANQLASAYLKLKQEELKVYIEPANYTDEHRRVKHFIVTRNVYGVDLNPTAVELGALSLWLGSSHKLLVKKGENGERDKYQSAATPWFGLRLRAGNSLIGARRAVWTREQLKQGEHLEQNTNPRLLKPGEERQKDEFYHFLVFDNQMIPLAYEKEAKEYYPKEIEIARKWIAESVRKRWEDEDLNRLRDISDSIDKHWNDYLLERLSALEKTQCTATVFPTPSNSELALAKGISLEEQEEVKRNLESASGSFQRLKLLLDTFCALYFWDLSAVNSLPSRDEFLVSAELLLRNVVVDKNTLAFYKMRLGTNIEVLLHSSNMHIPSTDDLESALSYYEVSRKIAEEEKFLHWELVFPEIFVKRILNGEFLILNEGASSIHNSKLKIHNSFGFDLINGNPPWIKVGWEEAVALGEIDPKLGVKGAKSAEFTKAKLSLLKEKEARKKYLNEFRRSIGTVTFLNSRNLYPELAGVQTNVYKNFIVRSWALLSARGIVGLLHPNSVFDDPNRIITKRILSRLKLSIILEMNYYYLKTLEIHILLILIYREIEI